MVQVYVNSPSSLKIGLSVALEATSKALAPQSVENLRKLSKNIPNASEGYALEISKYTASNFIECVENFKHTMTFRSIREDLRDALVNFENQAS